MGSGGATDTQGIWRFALTLLGLFLLLTAAITAVAAASQGELWSYVFGVVLLVLTLTLGVALVVTLGMVVGMALISPWAFAKACGVISEPPAAADAAEESEPEPPRPKRRTSLESLMLDESVSISKVHRLLELPPTLYIDDYTVMREVPDLLLLREGDHCVVGLNVLHNMAPMTDAILSLLTSWEAMPLRFFHHFIMVDSVASLDADGVPLAADGTPARIAEFSDTFPNGIKRVFAGGPEGWTLWPPAVLRNSMAVLKSPARYHIPPLASYLPPSRRNGKRGNGIYLVQPETPLSPEQRRATRATALSLSAGTVMPDYAVFTANCEHAAFMTCAQTRRWVSPQIAHYLWCLFRFALQLVGAAFLCALRLLGGDGSGVWHALGATLYHIFSTVPVAAQSHAQLVRTAVNLTQRRASLGQVTYDYLIVKESVRAIVVGGLSVGTIALMPRLVWDTGCVRLAVCLSLAAYGLFSLIFNTACQLVVRGLLRARVGVPVPLFVDVRESSSASSAAASSEQRSFDSGDGGDAAPRGGGAADMAAAAMNLDASSPLLSVLRLASARKLPGGHAGGEASDGEGGRGDGGGAAADDGAMQLSPSALDGQVQLVAAAVAAEGQLRRRRPGIDDEVS